MDARAAAAPPSPRAEWREKCGIESPETASAPPLVGDDDEEFRAAFKNAVEALREAARLAGSPLGTGDGVSKEGRQQVLERLAVALDEASSSAAANPQSDFFQEVRASLRSVSNQGPNESAPRKEGPTNKPAAPQVEGVVSQFALQIGDAFFAVLKSFSASRGEESTGALEKIHQKSRSCFCALDASGSVSAELSEKRAEEVAKSLLENSQAAEDNPVGSRALRSLLRFMYEVLAPLAAESQGSDSSDLAWVFSHSPVGRGLLADLALLVAALERLMTLGSCCEAAETLLQHALALCESLTRLPCVAVVSNSDVLLFGQTLIRAAARLLQRAAQLPDPALAVRAWMIFSRVGGFGGSRRKTLFSPKARSTGEAFGSASNVKRLCALLVAAFRPSSATAPPEELPRPLSKKRLLELRAATRCLREALDEASVREVLSGEAGNCAFVLASALLHELRKRAAEAESLEALRRSSASTDARRNCPAALDRFLVGSGTDALSEALACLLVACPPVCSAVASSRLLCGNANATQTLQDSQHSLGDKRASQTRPGDAETLSALFFLAAHGDGLCSLYVAAVLEACLANDRGLGGTLSTTGREEGVSSLAKAAGLSREDRAGSEEAFTPVASAFRRTGNRVVLCGSGCAELKDSMSASSLSLKKAAALRLLAVLWSGSPAFSQIVETRAVSKIAEQGTPHTLLPPLAVAEL